MNFARNNFFVFFVAIQDRIRQQYEPELESLKQNLEEKLDTIDRLELTIERIRTESPDATNLLATIESDKVAASRAVSQNQDLKSQLDEIQKAYIQLVWYTSISYAPTQCVAHFFFFHRATTN